MQRYTDRYFSLYNDTVDLSLAVDLVSVAIYNLATEYLDKWQFNCWLSLVSGY